MKPDYDIPDYLQATFHELVGIIREGLIRDGHVQLYQFGSFKLNWTKPRKTKDKKTGETRFSKPQPRVVFTPAKKLREMIHPDPEPVIPMEKVEVESQPENILDSIPPIIQMEENPDAANDNSRIQVQPPPKPYVGSVDKAANDTQANPEKREQDPRIKESLEEEDVIKTLYHAVLDEGEVSTNIGDVQQPSKSFAAGEVKDTLGYLSHQEDKEAIVLPEPVGGDNKDRWQNTSAQSMNTQFPSEPTGGTIQSNDSVSQAPAVQGKSANSSLTKETIKQEEKQQTVAISSAREDGLRDQAEDQTRTSPVVNPYLAKELDRLEREKTRVIPQYLNEKKTASKKWIGLLAMVPLIIIALQTEFAGHYPGMEKDKEPLANRPAVSVQQTVKPGPQITEQDYLVEREADRDTEPWDHDPGSGAKANSPGQGKITSGPKPEKAIAWFKSANDGAQGEQVEQGESIGVASQQAELQEFFLSPKVHKVVKGDNLWDLAQKHYGDPYLWPYIYRANQRSMDGPDHLQIDKKLVIPGLQHAPEYFSARDRQAVAEAYVMLYEEYRHQQKDNAHYFLIGAYRYHPDWLMGQKRRLDKEDLKKAIFWGGRLVAKGQ